MSTNAEFADADLNSNPFSDSFSQGESFASARPFPNVAESKPNLVVRTWRSLKEWVVGIGRMVFTKQFWANMIKEALRDALAALGYSVGMRLIKKASGAGDLNFNDKQNAAPHAKESVAGAAFSSRTNDSWQSQRRSYGGVMGDFMASPAGNEQFRHGTFTG